MPLDAKQQAKLDRVCERIAKGESLNEICKERGTPGYSTIMEWLIKDASAAEKYARAREDQADFHADTMLAVAKDTETDVNRARLIVDTMKWAASKLKPKKYGDKLELDAKVKLEGVEVRFVRPDTASTDT